MQVKKITIHNFKAIERLEFQLNDVNVLIGPNNAGKSSALQAIHLGSTLFRQANEANKDSTISLSELEYIPSESYRELSHNGQWGNAATTPESKMEFIFEGESSDGYPATFLSQIVVKSARNEGLSLKPQMAPELISILRSRGRVFTAYIPGISGIPVKEEKISRLHVFRKAASGDSNVVLRNILNIIKEDGKLTALEDLIKKVYPEAKIWIEFNEAKDYYIKVEVSFGGIYKPLEFAGTGFLQVLQILSYLILFKPLILLIDEPESHLHPTLQTRLVRLLQEQAEASNARIILTTHSPFVVRGLGFSARMIWVQGGQLVASSKGNEIRNALGWGAIDKKVLLLTEDSNVRLLENLIKQSAPIEDRIAIVPFEGVTKLGSAAAVENLRVALGAQHKIIVHRDKDCYLNKELEPWIKEYTDRNIEVWTTMGSDIESYFCEPSLISHIYGLSLDESKKILNDALGKNEEKVRKEFNGKRQNINKLYEKVGGSPSFDELWNEMSILEKAKGKTLLSAVRGVLQEKGADEKLLTKPLEGYSVAIDLMAMLYKHAFPKPHNA